MPGPYRPAALRGPAAAPAERPSVLRSFISPGKHSPAAAGRPRARITVPGQQGGITLLTTAPGSPLALSPLSPPGGAVRARQVSPPRPRPPRDRSSRGAAPHSPRRPQLPASPSLFLPFRNSPPEQSCVAQPVSKAAENTETAVLLTAQQCPTGAPPAPALPAPPRRQQRGEEAERAGQPGPAPGRREGWLLSLALLPAV